MTDLTRQRELMVQRQIRARGVRDRQVLDAMASVPREAFLPPELAEHAYADTPLPIAAGQTISQPYVVALMIEALELRGDETVLEIGTGSGYAAAVLGRVAKQVYTIERVPELERVARERLARLGFANVETRCGDGTLGWPEHAPYDAIIAAAGGPEVPRVLIDQLAIGGRLVIPIGDSRNQQLVRFTRVSDDKVHQEDLGAVRFVPLIGAHGWAEDPDPSRHRGVWPPRNPGPLRAPRPATRDAVVAKLVRECAEPIARIDDAPLDGLIERIGDARVVLLGEATHGTSEFYRMRTRITQELIQHHGFRAVAVEADWPDASAIDRYARDLPARSRGWTPFARFPQWMWRNRETQVLIEWLRAHNAGVHERASFSGLDLYSLYTSAYEVVRYLERVDPDAAQVARERYGRLTPWQHDPSAYGHAALVGRIQPYEHEVVAMLRDLLARRIEYSAQDGDEFFDAAMNARVVAGAERYYRAMFYGSVESWNLRDSHMFDTLRAILAHRGEGARLVVWEHNSHVGDARATEMAARGEHNVGQLCRAAFGDDVYIVGFGTDHGTVAAASNWDEAMQRMRVRPSRSDSYERLCHDAGVPAFLLHLRDPIRRELREELSEPRLERAIGVVYRPDSELHS
ncbi:MAG TPA: protein-L-isoaspartate(D-aspartate) O-methyltransferase, partial [Kofleriaceae bacterium]|nr:protein-L-isoaspartate(D-aspartate) O-methyltransferase [Kofleriaceae bacterium]